jgi:hypothetical protein
LFKHLAVAARSLFAAIVIKYFYEFLGIISQTKIQKLNLGGKVASGGIWAQKENQKWDFTVINRHIPFFGLHNWLILLLGSVWLFYI